jgi:hypothetical protein
VECVQLAAAFPTASLLAEVPANLSTNKLAVFRANTRFWCRQAGWGKSDSFAVALQNFASGFGRKIAGAPRPFRIEPKGPEKGC